MYIAYKYVSAKLKRRLVYIKGRFSWLAGRSLLVFNDRKVPTFARKNQSSFFDLTATSSRITESDS